MKKEVILPSLPSGIDDGHRRFYNEILDELKELRRETYELTTHENWIAVSYINSWVNFSTSETSEYYKDNLGYVHLKIACKNGITEYPFVMPIGYRPRNIIYFPIFSVPSGTTLMPYIYIKAEDGIVKFDNYTNTYVRHGEIIYLAEN